MDLSATRLDAEPLSHRAARIRGAGAFGQIQAFLQRVGRLRFDQPDVLDFSFGNPHEPPLAGYVDVLRGALAPQDDQWFAYKTNERVAQVAAADSLSQWLGLSFAPEDILMTTGGFTAIALAVKLVADPGDEVIFSLPPWFSYEPLLLEAGLVPVKIRLVPGTFDLDLDALAAAITPRTRAVIVNTPNNPTGRVYPPEMLRALAAVLEHASQQIGRRIYLVSDEAYNRIVFDGQAFPSPCVSYPATLLAYSYGKTLLAPGQRIGYLALPPELPGKAVLREAAFALQIAAGYLFPNALLQHALPDLEPLSLDVANLQAKRDRMVSALTEMGYRVRSPEGTFYLFPESPIDDDVAFADLLAAQGILVFPGVVFETPGHFRISLTANDDMIERSLPGFAAAIAETKGSSALDHATGSCDGITGRN